MRKFFVTAFVLAAVTVFATSAFALEKTSARALDRDDWNASTTGTIAYFNICTGWVWVWSGWSAGETMGTDFDTGPCSSGPFLNASWALTFSGVPSGYGFTGTIQAQGAGCGPVFAAQPYLPSISPAWTPTIWGGVPVSQNFSINIVWQTPTGFTNPTALASDHPFAGPTGPTSCGTCFPANRVSNSKYYGVGGLYCPSGTGLNDGLCDVEWLMSANVKCVVGVEEESWGQIKNLYK